MIRQIILQLLTGKNYDVSTELFGDFPRSRNFDVLILGGSKAYKKYGNYAYLGESSSDKKVLSLCYPYRTYQNNMEILRMYHSYLKKGGHVIFYHDPVEDSVIGEQVYYRNIRLLHTIQRKALGLDYSKFDYIKNILKNHRQSRIARERKGPVGMTDITLVGMEAGCCPKNLRHFCDVRGYELDYIKVHESTL